MKKILFLLLITISGYSQTLQNPIFGTVTIKNSATVTTTPALTTTEATGLQKKINPADLPISTATQTALNLKADNSILTTSDKTNQNVFFGVKKSTPDDALNNYEFSMARMVDGTIVRAGVYSATRYEQAFGAYIGFSKSTDDGMTWSSVTTIYTSVGETVELPTIGVVGTRITVLFRTTTGGANTYTNGSAKTAYSDNTGTSWTIGSNIVSPIGVILLPYGRIDQQGDGKYVAMLHNQNYCEAWETTDGINWAFRSTVYDYRSSPIGGTALLIEPNCIYIGSDKSIIVARNAATPSTTAPMQFISSNNLGTVTYSGVTNLTDGINTSLRANNPVAMLSDNTKRVLYLSTATRSYAMDEKIPNTHLIFVSDLDAVFASPTAYVLKYIIDKPVANGNTYNKGYHSLVLTSTGILGNFTESSVNFKALTDIPNTKINTSYQYSLFLTGTPFDFKNLVNFYPNSRQAKNTYTGNYDYITDFKSFVVDAGGMAQSRESSTYVIQNNTQDDAVPVAIIAGTKTGYKKYFEFYRNKSLTSVPLYINNAGDASGAIVQVQGNFPLASGEAPICRFFPVAGGGSLVLSSFMNSSVASYMMLKASGGLPFSLGTTSSMNAIYINSDGALKLGSGTTASSWLDMQASTTAHASFSIPVASAVPTTPISGAVWRASASILNFYDGSATQQFAFLASPTLTGTPTAPTATAGTNTTQVATTAFVLANARPYKVYVALLSQTGTSAPVATVLENTLGGTVVWTRSVAGLYLGTLSGAFTASKTICFSTVSASSIGTPTNVLQSQISRDNSNDVKLAFIQNATGLSDVFTDLNVEIRVYP